MATIDASAIGWQAIGKKGVVAAGGAAAVAAGIEILTDDGNAADAAAATILALNVTDHGACSIGGEVPVLIYDAKTGAVKSLSGQGSAPLDQAAIDWYMANGIPDKNIKMAPVPSVVDLCITLLQRYGTKRFTEIVAPTLAILDAGDKPWHPDLAVTLRRMVDEEARTNGTREERLQAACDRFYGRHPERNDIAEELEAFYIEQGGFLRRADLAAHKTLIEEPVSVNYRGYTVYKCGPWTQGPFLCQALRLLEGFDLPAMGHFSADYVHVLTEALKLAMADRDSITPTPTLSILPLDKLLSDAYTELRRPLIDMQQASPRRGRAIPMPCRRSSRLGPSNRQHHYLCNRRPLGNVVSATPSGANVYHDGGSGTTGVSYGNRLRSLSTNPRPSPVIQPGKRPRITLTPAWCSRAANRC
ncbi:MAG: gamma-glutamyltransferase [Caldilineaceae bacterium]